MANAAHRHQGDCTEQQEPSVAIILPSFTLAFAERLLKSGTLIGTTLRRTLPPCRLWPIKWSICQIIIRIPTDLSFMKPLSLLIFLLPTLALIAQTPSRSVPKGNYFESGFLFGLTAYSGDISEKSIDLAELHPGYGAYMRYHFNNHFSTRLHVYSGAVSGDDAHSSTLKERKIRFSSNIVELGLVGDWFLIGNSRVSNTGVHHFSLSPYVFAGAGVTFASADAEYYGPPDRRNENLRVPLPEEGLRNKFLLLPMGVGLRADLFEGLVIGLEAGWRPVFSDDLDGIRYNGNPKKGDWYYFGGTTVSFVLGNPNKHHRDKHRY